MLSVASVIVVTAFPLLLKKTPHQAAWWGGVLLLMSTIAFIAAFLLAGFVTVNYKAPDSTCASLHCADGGIECGTYAISVNGVGVYSLDPNVGSLNSFGNSIIHPLCIQYNASVAANAATTILLPANPQCPGTDSYSQNVDFRNCTAVRQLLLDPSIQRQVVCMSGPTFPTALPTSDITGYTIPIDNAVLRPYSSLTQFYEASPNHQITDLITSPGNQTSLISYYDLEITCYPTRPDHAAFDTLCNFNQGHNLSVTGGGQYLTEDTAAANAAAVFDTDLVSTQVATSIEVLSALFGLVVLLIIVYLIMSKLKQ